MNKVFLLFENKFWGNDVNGFFISHSERGKNCFFFDLSHYEEAYYTIFIQITLKLFFLLL